MRFTLTIRRSRDGQEYETIASGTWLEGEKPTINDGDVPAGVLESLSRIEMRKGGTHNLQRLGIYYQISWIESLD